MNKRLGKLLALMLALVFVLSGCSMLKINKEADDQTVVAEYDGGKILKADAMAYYAEVEAYYHSYGYELTDPEAIKEIKHEILLDMCNKQITRLKAEAMGLTALTDDEKTDLTVEVTAQFNDAIEYYKVYADEGATEEEQRQYAIDLMSAQNYTLESEIEYAIDNAWQDKLFNEITKDTAATEEEIQAAYDNMVAADTETYAESPYNFEYAMASGETVAWIPEGYRTVKRILIAFNEDQVVAIDDLSMELEDVRYQLQDETEEGDLPLDEHEHYEGDGHVHEGDLVIESDGVAEPTTDVVDETAAADLVAVQEPADLPDEDFGDEGDEPVLTREQLEAKEIELSAQLDALKAQYAATLQPKVDEVLAKISAGADFDQLIEEYGEDYAMTVEPAMSQGYYVCANSEMYDPEFIEAAMALQAVGDISAPVVGLSGIDIIRYNSDVTPGAVPLEGQLRASVEETALTEAKDAYYAEAIEKWMSEYNVKTYEDRMK